MNGLRYAKHLEPIWRDRSNFIIDADIPLEEARPAREQLWVRQVSENQFELCCIPFFLYDVALGDIVETDVDGERAYLMNRVVKPSGRFVFRIWFGGASHIEGDTPGVLHDVGALLEWSSPNMLAVDARDAAHASTIANLLADRERRGQLIYEMGRTGRPSN